MAAGFALALLVSINDGLALWWLALLLPALYVIFGRAERPRFNLDWLVLLFCLWIAISYVWIRPAPSDIGLFLLVFLVVYALAGQMLSLDTAARLYRIVLAAFCALAAWALFQYFIDGGYVVEYHRRASTVFATPNSFAAALNLVLFPLLAHYLCRPGRSMLQFAAAALLFAALIATQSRGGWLAFLAGSLVLAWFVHRHGLPFHRARWLGLGAAFVVILAVLSLARLDWHEPDAAPWQQADRALPLAGIASSGGHRLMLYGIAADLARERPVAGYGYYTFGEYLPREQDQRIQQTTRYVHNDYLQIAVETGIVGLLLLLAIVVMVLRQAGGVMAALAAGQARLDWAHSNLTVAGLAAALATWFAHALVDFMLYVPILMLLALFYIGVLGRHAHECHARISALPARFDFRGPRFRLAKGVALAVFMGVLLQPVIAQLAFHAAERQVVEEHADAEQVTSLYQLARSLAPYQPDYVDAEVDWLLRDLRVLDSDAARDRINRADDILRQAMATNPYDIRSQLLLARIHHYYRDWLDDPAPVETIDKWLADALAWRPHDEELRTMVKELREKGVGVI